MKVDTQPFETKHLYLLGETPFAKTIMPEGLNENCTAVTLTLGDKPVLILGVNVLHKGVLEVFFLPGSLFYSSRIKLVRETKKWYSHVEEEFPWHRIQALVREDCPSHCRFAEMLGLIEENTLMQYGPDKENLVIYSKVR